MHCQTTTRCCMTNTYDACCSPACWHHAGETQPPPELSRPMRQVSGLRYGENPHQPAAFYSDLSLAEHHKGGIATAQLHHGKEVCAFCLYCRSYAPKSARSITIHRSKVLLSLLHNILEYTVTICKSFEQAFSVCCMLVYLLRLDPAEHFVWNSLST